MGINRFQKEVKTKYISMKILPKGRSPPKSATAQGLRYHFFSGMGRGMVFTRHGLSGTPLQFLPKTVPSSTNGKEMNAQITNTTT
jgi:hypothetical protein